MDDTEFVTKAAAETNPSEAEFQAAAFLAELRDIGGLFQSVGSTMAKFGANEYLKFQYGWTPLIRDLKQVFQVMERLNKRMVEVQRLNSTGELRKRYRTQYDPHVDTWSVNTHSSNDVFIHEGSIIRSDIFTDVRMERWAQTVWVPDVPENLFRSIGRSQFDKVRSALYGVNIDGPTLWQIMPWSWIIDWNTNLSEYIESQNNTVGAKLQKVVLMKRTDLRTRAYPYWHTGPNSDFDLMEFNATPGAVNTLRKERIVDLMPQAVSTGEFTSILGSDFKLSILAALGIQRFRR
jgi:hypothetical protein